MELAKWLKEPRSNICYRNEEILFLVLTASKLTHFATRLEERVKDILRLLSPTTTSNSEAVTQQIKIGENKIKQEKSSFFSPTTYNP
jgi:hypothetical protein